MFRDVQSALEFHFFQRDLKRLSSRYCMDFTDTKAWCEILRGCQRSQGKRIHRVGNSKKGKRNKLQGQETLLKPIFKKICRINQGLTLEMIWGVQMYRGRHHICCCCVLWFLLAVSLMDWPWLNLEVTILARELGLKIELDDVPVALLQNSWGGRTFFFPDRFELWTESSWGEILSAREVAAVESLEVTWRADHEWRKVIWCRNKS